MRGATRERNSGRSNPNVRRGWPARLSGHASASAVKRLPLGSSAIEAPAVARRRHRGARRQGGLPHTAQRAAGLSVPVRSLVVRGVVVHAGELHLVVVHGVVGVVRTVTIVHAWDAVGVQIPDIQHSRYTPALQRRSA